MAEPPKIKGHFIINVAEASGKNKEDQLVWDPNFVEGFVKGIFVNDIMDAVPIDKYFELFKPGAGGEGGFIRISMDFVKTLKDRGGTADGAKAQPVGFKPALSFKGYSPENVGFGALKIAQAKNIQLVVKEKDGNLQKEAKKGLSFLKK
ncbi:hypothetical protein COCSUDRAFT_40718 [Coccomyxa subellipsoidea C-169]|uniref:Uncharacterized protein n=1 Tax=Coccomyxa subellipsoidea (strain C-169) TaxID=574566 RepID=I0Z4B6_COCSC|nr:hypothetical protein COCSUDRAFT_40718 [Coccomyxa subellipsoidea C-169]EIE25485.1 hypothetical protein COCSUDRAFT_40718 [Coccomyxa subellipsoidea C-169]|eukprot:XP_005650029.1 hypothetical protein COCSUDRAFT_40718 [Coccomyxa subellipsoidea C-169]